MHDQQTSALCNDENVCMLMGESHFERLRRPEYQEIRSKYVSSWLNHGIGGDAAENILWRTQQGCVHPRSTKIILSAGTNNVGRDPPRAIAATVLQLIKETRRVAPNATVMVLGILPRKVRGTHPQDSAAAINKANSLIKAGITDDKVNFYQPNPRLGKPCSMQYFERDGVHLNVKGYQVLFDDLLPFMEKSNSPSMAIGATGAAETTATTVQTTSVPKTAAEINFICFMLIIMVGIIVSQLIANYC